MTDLTKCPHCESPHKDMYLGGLALRVDLEGSGNFGTAAMTYRADPPQLSVLCPQCHHEYELDEDEVHELATQISEKVVFVEIYPE